MKILIKFIKRILGIKSPSYEVIRQWQLWQTLTEEEKEEIIEREENFYNNVGE